MGRGAGSEGNSILSVLALEILLYFNWWFSVLYICANVVIFAYKGFYLPYPPTAFGWELSFIFLYAVVEMIRLFQASKGNKTEQVQPLLWSFLLSISIILANSYYLDMQTYVMRIDVILNVVSLSFVGLEFILSVVALVAFWSQVG